MPPPAAILLAFANDWVDDRRHLRSLLDESKAIDKALVPLVETGAIAAPSPIHNATVDEVIDAFRQRRYRDRIRIFHFGGHASDSMLLFEDQGGRPSSAHAGGLAGYLGKQRGLVLVFLNGCCTKPQVRRLRDAGIHAVVATTAAIQDRVAAEFAAAFYAELATRSLRDAYETAVLAVRLRSGDDPRSVTRDSRDVGGVDDTEPPTWPWIFDCAPEYEGWMLASDLAHQSRSTYGSVPSTVGEPRFTGRDEELQELEAMLMFQTELVVVISGAPGLGKSRLAREYAHRHAETYPGGMFFISFEQVPPIDLAKLVNDTGGSSSSNESIEDRCRRALRTVGGAARTLLIYDAIADEDVVRDWLPYAGNDWHVIATSTSAMWARAWSRLDMRPLGKDAERTLVRSILGSDADDRLVTRVATRAAGITVELCATAAAVYRKLYLGHTIEDVAVELSKEATSSFETAWGLLSPEAQLALQVASTFVIARFPSSLVAEALQRVGWSASAVDSAIDETCVRQFATRDGETFKSIS